MLQLKKTTLLISALVVPLAPLTTAGWDFGKVGVLTGTQSRYGPLLPEPSRPAVKDWTIMVFMNARNNLEYYGLKDLNEMEPVGSGNSVNIVAELGRIAGHDVSDGDWRGSRRYLVHRDDDSGKINSTVLREFWEPDMGDWRHLAEFGRWAKANFPARRYILIVWNHGSGWRSQGRERGISFDDVTGGRITTPELGLALREIGKVDVYASDACLMQMAEVAYEIREYADYIVQSEETEPADGYKYDWFLGSLVSNPSTDAETAAGYMVDSYGDYYQGLSEPATQSALRAAALPRFKTLLDEWLAIAAGAGEKELLKAARRDSLYFRSPNNRDLYDFISRVSAGTGEHSAAQKGAELLAFMKDRLVIANRTVSPGYEAAHGLSIYSPDTAYNKKYDELSFARESGWDEFIKWLR